MNTYDPQTTQSDFIDGFAAGAELSRQAAFEAWLRFHPYCLPFFRKATRKEHEELGFDHGYNIGVIYAGKLANQKPMTAEQHNKYPKGRWT